MATFTKSISSAIALLFLATCTAQAGTCGRGTACLFGTPLKNATRFVLQKAAVQAGVKPIRQDDRYFCDLYDGKDTGIGANQLAVCYVGPGNSPFAAAEYTFKPNRKKAFELANMISMKYGGPVGINGQPRSGRYMGTWATNGGISVVVRREGTWKETYLDYNDPKNKAKMEAAIKAAEAAAKHSGQF